MGHDNMKYSDIEQYAEKLRKNPDIDTSDITSQLLAKDLPKIYGAPKLFILTLMINTKMSENVFAQLTDKFANSIPSQDWSKNIMVCNFSKLVEK